MARAGSEWGSIMAAEGEGRQLNKSKWDIHKIESKGVKFGTGAHIIIPASWAGKTVIAMLKSKWEELQQK